MAPPPPPPPPLCFPFGSGRRKRRTSVPSFDEKSYSEHSTAYTQPSHYAGTHYTGTHYTSRTVGTESMRSGTVPRSTTARSLDLANDNDYSPTATMTSRDKLTFKTDSESYGNLPTIRSLNSGQPAKKKGLSRRWGYGWGLGKARKEKLREKTIPEEEREPTPPPAPAYDPQTEQYVEGQDHYDPAYDGQYPPMQPLDGMGGMGMGMGHGGGVALHDPPMPQMLTPPQSPPRSEQRSLVDSPRQSLGQSPRQSWQQSPRQSFQQSPGHSPGQYFRQSPRQSTQQTQPTPGPSVQQTPMQTPQRSAMGSVARTARTQITTPARSDKPLTKSDSRASRPPMVPSKQSTMGSQRRPHFSRAPSESTLVGSAIMRKETYEDNVGKIDTTDRLYDLRAQMDKQNLDFYIVPSADAHGSEYVAPQDKRREWITGFSGSAGTAIVARSDAWLATDSRYWLQADAELDNNWQLIKNPDWGTWLLDRVHDGVRIGIDARMISYSQATNFTTLLQRRVSGGKVVYPPQNLIDFIWKDKPMKGKEPINIHPLKFAGETAAEKIAGIRRWIESYPAAKPSYAKGEPTPKMKHVATLVTALPEVAWTLNLRGRDVPYNPVFHAYLWISLDMAILFVDQNKLTDAVRSYLQSIDVETREYNDVWKFLRRPEWGDGKVLIGEQTSHAIALMLTSFRYTVSPTSHIETEKAIKNATEIKGVRNAYLRDGASFVRWYAWLEEKMSKGFNVTEWEAAFRLDEIRRKSDNYVCPAYESISATGPNAALPHYTPKKSEEVFLNKVTPYLNDSGGQYLDGTTDTTRTVHFGHPTVDQCEAYTKVLQGHIAIDSAIFPEGTSGAKLDVLARRSLWKDGLDYGHGTGHGTGSFLSVHEGPQGFSSTVPLIPGHVVTNEPGYYNDGQWGMRIESALLVRQVRTKYEQNGDIWLGFERLTCVPIQTKMVKDSMLTNDERAWIKDHNKRCYDMLAPFVEDDKRALRWLRREADHGLGSARSSAY